MILLHTFLLTFLSALVLFQCIKNRKKKMKMMSKEETGNLIKQEDDVEKENVAKEKTEIVNSDFVSEIPETEMKNRMEQKEKKTDDVDKTQERTRENTETGKNDYEKITDEKIAELFKSDSSDDVTVSQKTESKTPITVAPTRMIWKETTGEQFLTAMNDSSTPLAIKMRCSNNEIYDMCPVYTKIEPHKSIEIKITRKEAPHAPDRISIVAAVLTTEANSEKEVQTFFKNYHGKLYEANVTLLPQRLL